jgi:hypothetical protein
VADSGDPVGFDIQLRPTLNSGLFAVTLYSGKEDWKL